jgi:sugar/nucleoside kinase (ribokinase family)
MAALAMGAGVRLLVVTLGPKGVVYFAAAGVDSLKWAGGLVGGRANSSDDSALAHWPTGPLRTALLPAPSVNAIDPTGCGDVFGAALCARLVAGDPVESAIQTAQGYAARNATLRGATVLGPLLRGELVAAEASA